MSRLNIEDSLFTDARFLNLCIMLKSEIKAIGWWVKVARLAQSYWKNDKELIPEAAYKFGKFPCALIDSGIIELTENGYYLRGSEQFFAWIFSCVENGRKGGRPLKVPKIKDKAITQVITHEEPTRNLPTPTPTPTPNPKEKYIKENSHDKSFELTVLISEIWNKYADANYLQRAPKQNTMAFAKYHKAASRWFKDFNSIETWEKIIRVAVKQENPTSGWKPDYMHIFRNTNPDKYLAEFENNERVRNL